MDIGRGRVEIGREKFMHPSPVEIEAETMQVPDDPDTPEADDPTDAELSGEEPEDLSGPDDDDALPD
jgi:hypothetical protein